VSHPHPYQFEIEQFDTQVDDFEFSAVEPEKYKKMEDTPFLFVQTQD